MRRRCNFNSRPSARGDGIVGAKTWAALLFQFTPLREGRLEERVKRFELSNFNSRPSARGDFHGLQLDGRLHISIHAPPRGATGLYAISSVYQIFQFTPLREGRHNKHGHRRAMHYFNSRPSARGDVWQFASAIVRSVFQFTPLREGRQLKPKEEPNRVLFQFTPLREGRPMLKAEFLRARIISIHAPPRGATAIVAQEVAALPFQFTPLREGRQVNTASKPLVAHHFNSRPSARGDDSRTNIATRIPVISIHAPPRGATAEDIRHSWNLLISIHAPPRGATFTAATATRWRCYFNSRPSARGDNDAMPSTSASCLFQFTPLREGRHEASLMLANSFISIHAPPRGATWLPPFI